MASNASVPGRVLLVGAGPGDPGLITLKGSRALAEADVILYDALVNPSLLRLAGPGCEAVFVGKRAGKQSPGQEEINGMLVAGARSGKVMVRLKGGDPFIFGRGGEEALACRQAGVSFSVVPGVTSALAAPAYAGIPATHRGLSADVLIVAGTEAGQLKVDWRAAAKAGTVVLLMGAATLAEATAALITAGRDPSEPAAAVEWATLSRQRVVQGRLADLAERVAGSRLGAPLVAVFGEVVALREQLHWFEPGPLAGRRIVVTRARTQASELTPRFEALGAEVLEAPSIRVVPRIESPELRDALAGRWAWIAFTSANGVDAAFSTLRALGRDARAWAGARLAAVGEATAAALRARGLEPDFVARDSTAPAFAAAVPIEPGDSVLVPQSSLAAGEFAAAITAKGGSVTAVAAYDTVPVPLDEPAKASVLGADAVTFASSSSARSLASALAPATLGPATRLISIGPQTSRAVTSAFGRVDAEASRPALDELVEATRRSLV